MLLIFPPVAKVCEPSAGIARLGGVLKAHGVNCRLVDMNMEAVSWLWEKNRDDSPKFQQALNQMQSKKAYENLDRYKQAVKEITRVLNLHSEGYNLTLSNYMEEALSPLISENLLQAAKNYRKNPFFAYFSERLEEIIPSLEHNIIGFSLHFLNQALCTFAIMGYLKEKHPHIKIVLGGGLITSWMRGSRWNNPFKELADVCVDGPGEIPLLEMAGVTPSKELLDNALPDYDFTENLPYLAPGPVLPVSASFGCSWKNCTFCPEKAEDNPFIPRKIKRVIREFQELKKKYNPVLIHMTDNEITPSLLKHLAADPPGVEWYGFTRFYNCLKEEEFCHKLKKAGCAMLKLGLESGDQAVLDGLNKGIRLEDTEIILANLKKAGITTYIYLLFGTPAEDYNSAVKTKNFIKKHAHEIGYLNLAIFNLPIDSDMAREQKVTDFYSADLSMYVDFVHPGGWGRREIREFLSREFKTDPHIRPIIQRTHPLFNANHAPFLAKYCGTQ